MASAWMRLESIKIFEPSTSPAAKHWQSILSKKPLKAAVPQRLLPLLRTLVISAHPLLQTQPLIKHFKLSAFGLSPHH
jgi:hypothetical protein